MKDSRIFDIDNNNRKIVSKILYILLAIFSLTLNTATGGPIVSCSFGRINPSVATSSLVINGSNTLSHERLTSDDELIFSVASCANL
jgi:hypothetical protein